MATDADIFAHLIWAFPEKFNGFPATTNHLGGFGVSLYLGLAIGRSFIELVHSSPLPFFWSAIRCCALTILATILHPNKSEHRVRFRGFMAEFGTFLSRVRHLNPRQRRWTSISVPKKVHSKRPGDGRGRGGNVEIVNKFWGPFVAAHLQSLSPYSTQTILPVPPG